MDDKEIKEIPEIEIVQEEEDEKLKEAMDRYQRTLAEFDNYRKRTVKELAARYDDGMRGTCEKLLPIIDNLQRAISTHENKEDTLYKGVIMIARQFSDTLAELGVQEIEEGTEFDPNLHNAVAHIEDENYGQNEIVEVLQKGYIHKDKVLRHSMVKVAN